MTGDLQNPEDRKLLLIKPMIGLVESLSPLLYLA